MHDYSSESKQLSITALVVLTLLIGSIAAAFSTHVLISLIARGDGGMLLALGSGAIFFVELTVILVFGAIAVPVGAALSWPFRGIMISKPVASSIPGAILGATTGYATSFLFADHWLSAQVPGIVSGAVFAIVWVMMIHRFASETDCVE